MKTIVPCLLITLLSPFFLLANNSNDNKIPAITGGHPAIDPGKPAGTYEFSGATGAFSSIVKPAQGVARYTYTALYDRIETLKNIASKNESSTQYGILIDLSIMSGHKRFFVIDLTTATIVGFGLVSSQATKYASMEGVYTASLAGNTNAFMLQSSTSISKQSAGQHIIPCSAGDTPDDEVIFDVQGSRDGLSLSPGFFAELTEIMHTAAKPLTVWIYANQQM